MAFLALLWLFNSSFAFGFVFIYLRTKQNKKPHYASQFELGLCHLQPNFLPNLKREREYEFLKI